MGCAGFVGGSGLCKTIVVQLLGGGGLWAVL